MLNIEFLVKRHDCTGLLYKGHKLLRFQVKLDVRQLSDDYGVILGLCRSAWGIPPGAPAIEIECVFGRN